MHWTVKPGKYCMRFPPAASSRASRLARDAALPCWPKNKNDGGIVARYAYGVKRKCHKI
jgi:hypothetical protein